MRILIVDDSVVQRKVIKDTLTNIMIGNPSIVEARNGKEAVDFFKAHKPELVFMDINMPVINIYFTY